MLATTSSLAGAIILTSSLSYIISVVGASIRRRTYASSVMGLGEDPAQIIPRLRLGDPQQSMHQHLTTVAFSLSEVPEQQLTYPVLRYFHTARAQSSPAVATLVLADTQYLLLHSAPEQQMAPGLTVLLDSAIDTFIQIKDATGPLTGTIDDAAVIHQQAVSLGLRTGPDTEVIADLPQYLQPAHTLGRRMSQRRVGSRPRPRMTNSCRPAST